MDLIEIDDAIERFEAFVASRTDAPTTLALDR